MRVFLKRFLMQTVKALIRLHRLTEAFADIICHNMFSFDAAHAQIADFSDLIFRSFFWKKSSLQWTREAKTVLTELLRQIFIHS